MPRRTPTTDPEYSLGGKVEGAGVGFFEIQKGTLSSPLAIQTLATCQEKSRLSLSEMAVEKGFRVIFPAEAECETDREHEPRDDDRQIVSEESEVEAELFYRRDESDEQDQPADDFFVYFAVRDMLQDVAKNIRRDDADEHDDETGEDGGNVADDNADEIRDARNIKHVRRTAEEHE